MAIDTSTDACSVALSVAGDVLSQIEVTPRLHARKLLPMISRLLSEADLSLDSLDAISFARGPGSFTGIRIAAGITQGLAFGAELPVIPVSTMAVMALGAIEITGGDAALVSLDARMGQVYWAAYLATDAIPQLLGEEELQFPSAVELNGAMPANAHCVGVGSGWQYQTDFPQSIVDYPKSIDIEFLPDARYMLPIAIAKWHSGTIEHPEAAIPVYLRGKEAWRKQPTAVFSGKLNGS